MAKGSTKIEKPYTKAQLMSALAEQTGLTRKQVESVFEALTELMASHLGKRGPKVFKLGDLVKFTVVRKPATRERKGVNPFTGEEIIIKAKPARNVVRARPLKKLKDMVS
jgi:nucleoid DNA-binding protein